MTDGTHIRQGSPAGVVGIWATLLLGTLLVLAGLTLLAGGVWLLALGGSFYYAIAGSGVTVTGVLLVMRRRMAVIVYAATFLFTLIWAVWEAGFDGWAQIPRLLGPTIVMVLVLLCVPVLRKKGGA